MADLTIPAWAALGVPVGGAAWRVAQTFIERRSLEEGDLELRLPWYSAVVLEVIVFGGLAWRFDPASPAVLVTYLVLFFGFTILLLIDFGRYALPDVLVGSTLVAGLAGTIAVGAFFNPSPDDVTWNAWWAVTGAVFNLVMYFVFWLIAQLAFGNRGLGFGDVKLAAPLGLALGWMVGDVRDLMRVSLWALLIGFASGAISGVLILRGVKLRRSFPQGPFLVLGTFVVIVFASSFMG